MGYSHGETVTRQRGVAATDPYSTTSTDLAWTSPTTVDYAGCAIWQETSTEPTEQGRASVVTITKVALPATADITARDRFVARGVTYEVVGGPETWRSPFTGWEPGVVVVGRRVDG